MKTSFNSIGKAFKKMFGRKSQQATTPVVANAVKKQEQAEKRHKIPKMRNLHKAADGEILPMQKQAAGAIELYAEGSTGK